jgi:hypothetical protein
MKRDRLRTSGIGFPLLRGVALLHAETIGMLVRNRRTRSCATMTDRPAGEEFLTVDEVARLRQITPAAVRAQLRAGSLAGEQVLQGQRTVWRIPASAVRRPEGEVVRRPAPAPDPAPPAPNPVAPAQPVRPSPAPTARVEALEAEVRRLRRQLAALSDAHRRLLDTVTAGLADDRV